MGAYKTNRINLSQVTEVAGYGVNIKTLIEYFGISRSKFDSYRLLDSEINEFCENNPEFNLADVDLETFNPAKYCYRRGKSQGVLSVLQACKKAALEGSTHAMKLYLQSQGAAKAPETAVEKPGTVLNLLFTNSDMLDEKVVESTPLKISLKS